MAEETEVEERTMKGVVVREKNREPASPRKQQKKPDSNGGGVVSLDDDTVTEILVRLPVKCVITLQLVCKWWLSVISSDQFRRLHTLRRHRSERSLILGVRHSSLELFYPIGGSEKKQMRTPFDNFKILSCSNGLVLLQCQDYNNDDYYVCNPITKQSRKLRLANNDENKFIRVESLHLLFDPSVSPYYKIVCVWADEEHPTRRRTYQIDVFDSECGTWRVCVEPFTSGEVMTFDACVEFKSLIYLIHHRPALFGCVYYFDIVKNVSRFIVCPVPERVQEAAYNPHTLQESNGRLYYCALLRDGPLNSAAVWELQVNEDDPLRSKWVFKYENRLPKRIELELLTFIAETSTVLVTYDFLDNVPRKIMSYNFLDKSCKKLTDLEPHVYSVNVHQFGETLALL